MSPTSPAHARPRPIARVIGGRPCTGMVRARPVRGVSGPGSERACRGRLQAPSRCRRARAGRPPSGIRRRAAPAATSWRTLRSAEAGSVSGLPGRRVPAAAPPWTSGEAARALTLEEAAGSSTAAGSSRSVAPATAGRRLMPYPAVLASLPLSGMTRRAAPRGPTDRRQPLASARPSPLSVHVTVPALHDSSWIQVVACEMGRHHVVMAAVGLEQGVAPPSCC